MAQPTGAVGEVGSPRAESLEAAGHDRGGHAGDHHGS